MYSRSYGDLARARALFREFPEEVRAALAGMHYGEAEARCPHRMPIGELMREAASELV
jgi:hypothetical protein